MSFACPGFVTFLCVTPAAYNPESLGKTIQQLMGWAEKCSSSVSKCLCADCFILGN